MEDHYSYKVYENPDVAAGFDEEKFGGPVGMLFREHQESLLRRFLPDVVGKRILDLGAGTGRASLPLSQRGAKVAAADASAPMLRVASEKAWLQGYPIQCFLADAHHLPFPDRAFDIVISFRMLMHVVDWSMVLSEICRTAGERIILDFPPRSGFAGLAPLVHPIKRLINPNHQSYRVFNIRTITESLGKLGFEVDAIDRHIVLPFGFHRLIGSTGFTQKIEKLLSRMGVTDLMGAPVTVTARRMKRS